MVWNFKASYSRYRSVLDEQQQADVIKQAEDRKRKLMEELKALGEKKKRIMECSATEVNIVNEKISDMKKKLWMSFLNPASLWNKIFHYKNIGANFSTYTQVLILLYFTTGKIIFSNRENTGNFIFTNRYEPCYMVTW